MKGATTYFTILAFCATSAQGRLRRLGLPDAYNNIGVDSYSPSQAAAASGWVSPEVLKEKLSQISAENSVQEASCSGFPAPYLAPPNCVCGQGTRKVVVNVGSRFEGWACFDERMQEESGRGWIQKIGGLPETVASMLPFFWSSINNKDSTDSSAPVEAAVGVASAASYAGKSYDANLGQKMASFAAQRARSRNTVGKCYNAVADVVDKYVSRFLYGNHAYQAADQLARSSRFVEVSNSDLRRLPAGAIVVWGKGSSRSGHISIALGNGQEASDHVAQQMTSHYGGARARVFLPK